MDLVTGMVPVKRSDLESRAAGEGYGGKPQSPGGAPGPVTRSACAWFHLAKNTRYLLCSEGRLCKDEVLSWRFQIRHSVDVSHGQVKEIGGPPHSCPSPGGGGLEAGGAVVRDQGRCSAPPFCKFRR